MHRLVILPALAGFVGFLTFTVAFTPPAHAGHWFDAGWYCHSANAHAIAVADVTGDGHLDVVAAAGNGIQVLPGAGDGTLGAYQSMPTGRDATSLAIADLDDDTRPDVVCANPTDGTIDVFMGTPSGLAPSAMHAVGGAPIGVAIADMNLDGDLDVVIGGSPIRILHGDGTGGLSSPMSTGVNGEFAVGDVNGDEWPDLAVIVGTDVRIFLSLSGASFAPGAVRSFEFEPMVVGLADLDGDDDLDLVTGVWGTTVFVFPGNGAGGFAPRPAFETHRGDPTGFRLGFGEVNGDGVVDLIAAFHVGGQFSNWVEVRSSAGHVNEMQGELVRSIAIGDFDEDGAADLATAGSCGVGIAINRGDGLEFGPPRFHGADYPAGLSAGDLDGDGHDDLVGRFEDYESVLAVLDPSTESPVRIWVSPDRYPNFAGILDVDDDGHGDLFVGSGRTWVAYYRWQTGGFAPPLEYQADADTVPVGDLDGDGHPDAVVRGWEFLPGASDGGYGTPRRIPQGSMQVAADFDLDGFQDRATLGSTVHIERGVPGGGFSSVEHLGIGEIPRSITTGDFDGDGRLDLAVANRGSDEDNNGVFAILRNRTADATTSVLVRRASVSSTFDRVGVSWELGRIVALSHVVRVDDAGTTLELGAACGRCNEYSIVDRNVVPGARYTYRLIAASGQVIDQVDVTVPVRTPRIDLSVMSPTLANRELGITLALPQSGLARVSMLDASGRTIAQLRVSGEANRSTRHALAPAGALRPGIYWIRVEQHGRATTKKVVVVS